MRAIAFRGKSEATGKWIYGAFIPDLLEVYQSEPDRWGAYWGFIKPFEKTDGHRYMVEVTRETVGQYTGLKDKNGTRIFEGDIVKLHYFFDDMDFTTFDLVSGEKTITAAISIGDFGIFIKENGLTHYLFEYSQQDVDIEVIGNIYDNPELLEENNG